MMYFIAPHFVMAVIIMYTVITFYIALTSIQTLHLQDANALGSVCN